MRSAYKSVFIGVCLANLVFLGSALPVSSETGDPAVSAGSILLSKGNSKDGEAELKALEAKFKKARAYVFSSQLVTYKKGKKIKECGKFYYKDPNLIRFEVADGSKNAGSVVVRQPDGRIKGKAGGFLGKLVVSLSPNSKLLKTSNGFNILKSDFETLLEDLIAKLKAGRKCVASASPFNLPGRGKSHVIEVLSNSGAVEQRLVVDASTKLPREWVLFQNSKIFSITSFSALQLNAKIANELFVLDKGNMLANAKAVGAFLATPQNITYDGKELDEAMLSKDMLEDMKKLIKSLRDKSDYLTENTATKDEVAKSLKEKERQNLFVVATQIEMVSDNLRTVGRKLEELDSQFPKGKSLSSRWNGFLDSIDTEIENIYQQVELESANPKPVYNSALKIEQETRRLDNIIFNALKRI